jgi:phosphoenolpyruvate carboxykinase (ATP)
MWKAKEQGMLSLHAGSKIVNSKQENGSLQRHGVLFFGLSGTGKSTHSCHDHNMKHEGEGIEILQDDIVFLGKDGSALGTEKGFYLKTEGLNQEFQPVIHEALHGKETLLENVMVDSTGNIVLDNLTLGGNGRAVIPREAMRPYISEDINMPPLEELDGLMIFFITRRMTVLPLASKLTSEQAATAFMLGESIETSAGDPLKVGQSVRVVGTNPFVIGDPVNEGNWFYDFVKANEDKVQCFLLNTGGVGEIAERDANGKRVIKQPVLRVDISEMSAIIRNILRGTIEWQPEPNFGTMVPKSIDDLDINKFSLDKFYTKEQIDELTKTLHEERTNWLHKFDGLSKQVVDALSPTS